MAGFKSLYGMYMGRPLCGNPFLPEFSSKPAKELKLKPWMAQKIYPKRVQKKWIKQFGMVEGRVFVLDDEGRIHAHPNSFKALIVELEKEGLLK